MYWINIYLGPLDLIISDIGKNFINKEFKEYINTMGIYIKPVLVKAYNSISIVKRYYSLLQQVY